MPARIAITSVQPDTSGMGAFDPGEPRAQVAGKIYDLRYDVAVYIELPPGPACELEAFLPGLRDEHTFKARITTGPLEEGVTQRYRYTMPVHSRLTWFNPFAHGLLERVE